MPQWQMFDPGERRKIERLKHQRKLDCQMYISAQVRLGLRPAVWLMRCLSCGAQADAYHHPDYRQPDNVVPLCCRCHAKTHQLEPPNWDWFPDHLESKALLDSSQSPPEPASPMPVGDSRRLPTRPEPRGEARARAILAKMRAEDEDAE